MIGEVLIAIGLGIGVGIVTGLIPGLHINLVSILVVSFSVALLAIADVVSVSVFIIAMSITHTFLDVIPAIFLGAPDADTALGVLPGHQLLLQGQGYEAVRLTVIGSLLSLVVSVLLVPLFILVLPVLFGTVQDYIGYFLLSIVVFMILREKTVQRMVWSLIVFLLSGILGIFVLTWPNLEQPLFPLKKDQSTFIS